MKLEQNIKLGLISISFFILLYQPKMTAEILTVVFTREYKSREVTQSPIYVIVHSLLEVSFCT